MNRGKLKEAELNIAIDIMAERYTEKLPTQEQLCMIYGISRDSVQKVLKNLVAERVIGVRKNKCYIIPPDSTVEIYVLKCFAQKLHDCDLILKRIGFNKKQINDLLGLRKIVYKLPEMVENLKPEKRLKLEKIENAPNLEENELSNMSKLLDNISFDFEDYAITNESVQECYQEVLEEILF